MVYLNRIYTKSGDGGETGLGDGARVPKDSPRIEAIGQVDELNATIGLAVAEGPESPDAALLRAIQNELFDVGADLCIPIVESEPGDSPPGPGKALRVTAAQVQRLEEAIDRFNANLSPLTSFVLPGGSRASAWLHLGRTVCRRAERAVVALSHAEAVNPRVVIYLNRLSDLLFVMARAANGNGAGDVLWAPGQEPGS